MNQRSHVLFIIYQDGSVFAVEGSKLHQKRVSDATPCRIKCNAHWIPPSREFEKKAPNPASANKKEKFLKNRQRIQYWYSCLSEKEALQFPPSSCCQKKCQIIHKCSSESAGRNMVAWMWEQNRNIAVFYIMSGKCSIWACCIFPPSLPFLFSCCLWAC